MVENKLKHLEFIQNVITRMNSNSFLLKGWCVTIIAAILVLSAKNANVVYGFVALIPLPTFWILDAFYLSKEKQYRALYKKVSATQAAAIDFSMSTKEFDKDDNTWHRCILTKTLLPFYGTILGSLIVVGLIVGGSSG